MVNVERWTVANKLLMKITAFLNDFDYINIFKLSSQFALLLLFI